MEKIKIIFYQGKKNVAEMELQPDGSLPKKKLYLPRVNEFITVEKDSSNNPDKELHGIITRIEHMINRPEVWIFVDLIDL